MMVKWQLELGQFEVTKEGTVAKCDFQKILNEIEDCKMPIKEFKVEELWTNFLKQIQKLDKLVKGIKQRKETIEHLRTSQSIHKFHKLLLPFISDEKKSAMAQMSEEMAKMKQDEHEAGGIKPVLLWYLKALIKQMEAIN